MSDANIHTSDTPIYDETTAATEVKQPAPENAEMPEPAEDEPTFADVADSDDDEGSVSHPI